MLVIVGLYVRLKISETPAFQYVLKKDARVKIPVLTVFREHGRVLVLGTLIALSGGMTYGPLGTMLSELFSTAVRYACILGASLAPYPATWLATNYGLHYVGYYLSIAALISLLTLLMISKSNQDGQARST